MSAPLPEALRQRHIEALERRAAGQPPAVQRLLQARALRLREALAQQGPPQASPPASPMAPPRAPTAGPLAALLALIEPRAEPRTEAPAPAELKAVREHRGTWRRLAVQRRLTQALTQVPDNAGPLNTQRLLHQALAVLDETSPAYLQRLVQQVEALLWLEQLSPPAVAAKVSPKKARPAPAP